MFEKLELQFTNVDESTVEKISSFYQEIAPLLMEHQLTISLIENATSRGDVTINFVGGEDPHLKTGGCIIASERLIKIKASLSPYGLLQTLIFELHNISNEALQEVKLENFSNADDFAMAIETQEHNSYVSTKKLLIDLMERNKANFALVASKFEISDEYDETLSELKLEANDSFDECMGYNSDHIKNYKDEWNTWQQTTLALYKEIQAKEKEVSELSKLYAEFTTLSEGMDFSLIQEKFVQLLGNKADEHNENFEG